MLNMRTSISSFSILAACLSAIGSSSASLHHHTHIRNLDLSVRKVVGGSTKVVTGTVTLSEAAGTGGDVVTLKSSNIAVASVPATVTVAAGSKTATFTVTVAQVLKPKEVEIEGKLGEDDEREAELKVSPFEVKGFLFTPAVIKSGSIFGGFQSTSGTITLGDVAGPSGIAVTITLVGSTQTFPVVTVPTGSKTASFSLTPGSVSTTTVYVFVASVGKSNQSTQLTVTP